MTGESRDLYAREALPQIGSILQQLDRNPLSPTSGCFDRQYWHYRTMDFPTGMSQEFVLPLALVFRHPFPDNPYHGQERVREWVLAGIDFARRSAHRDGSCDDYYPFERALGAAVFSLYAMAEACRIIDAEDDRIRDFLALRARWIMAHTESGILSNHHAIGAAALCATGRLLGDDGFVRHARQKAEDVLGYQHEEGWFREYEGFDPGYQTVTVDFLARYARQAEDDRVIPALERAVALLERVQHPDGLFGGEYGARNTYHVQPHGFEILAPRCPAARRVADRFLRALEAKRRPRNDDDRLQGHHVYPYLMAWLDFAERPPEPTPAGPPAERAVLTGCGFLIDRREERFLIAGLRKGAPFRAFLGSRLVANDSGPVLVLEDGRILVTHLTHDAEVEDDGVRALAKGAFRSAKSERMTPAKNVVLRLLMLTVGRFFRTFIRRVLQRRLILGGKASSFRFERAIEGTPAGWRIVDRILADRDATPVRHLRIGVGQTSIYIAASQPWEPGWLLPWTDLDACLGELSSKGVVEHVRDV